MTKPISRELWESLSRSGQEHLVAFWDQLKPAQQQHLESQIQALDLTALSNLFQQETSSDPQTIDWSATRPAPVYQREAGDTDAAARAYQLGVEALRANKVAVVLVAGGQGSRLGFEQPKGLFPIGSISKRSLLQVLMDRITAMENRYDSCIPLYLMTSPQTDQIIKNFLEQHHHFGMDASQIKFCCQDVMPAMDQRTGRILMEATDSLALSPNGHGGMLTAIARQGCLADALQRNVEHLFYGQIDNPLLPICDPQLIGYHLLGESEMSTHVVRKIDATEKVGVALLTDDRFRIVEYSHFPEEVATRTDEDGRLVFWAGSIGSHVFNTSLLNRSAPLVDVLPYHATRKNVPCLDTDGTLVTSDTLNAFKFERFIFELAAVAKNPVAVEVNRQETFAPVKNANSMGVDTPETARETMSNLYRSWLTTSGISISPGIDVEIDSRWALDQQEVADKLAKTTRIDRATYFHP